MTDNAAPLGTTDTQAPIETAPPINPGSFSWKSQMLPDFANSPTMNKFPDTKDGFNNAVKSHLELEKMLGQNRVVVPKDDKDTEGWNAFAKAMGVPDKAEGYGLEDPDLPQELKGFYNKQELAELAHALKLTPGQTKQLQSAYVDKMKTSYSKAAEAKKVEMQGTINRLRSDWGDAYDSNVQLGQMVINKFSADKETEDFVTSTILSDPRGAKFLAGLGKQFQENKIGDFKYQSFSLTPDQAQAEIDSTISDKNHPYNNDKLPQAQRQRAIDRINSLYQIISKAQGQA